MPSTLLSKLEVREEKPKVKQLPKKAGKNTTGVIIAGSTDILSTLATCCNPVYGE